MPGIYKAENPDEILSRERCFVREIANTPDIPSFSLAETRVEPGITTELHRLDVNEWYLMKTGRGMMEFGGEIPVEVGPGDIVEIPAGTSQRISNHGEVDLIFLCVCLPRFTPEGYEPLETD